MAKTEKWVAAEPEQTLQEVARRALDSRLRAVLHYYRRAVGKATPKHDDLHQLRVWSRRSAAALALFEDLLPDRRTRWIKKQLRRLRRAAGESRDLWLLSRRLEQLSSDKNDPGRAAVLERIRLEQKTAAKPMRKLPQRLPKKLLKRRIAKFVSRVSAPETAEPSFGAEARRRLAPIVEVFFQADSDASDDGLHRFRIAGKRLRYAMEVLAGAFDPSFRAGPYEAIEQLQEKLGEVNDHVTSVERYEQWLGDTDDYDLAAQLRRLVSQERAAVKRARRKFSAWWTPERGLALKQQFDGYLNSNPHSERFSTQRKTTDAQTEAPRPDSVAS